MLVVVCGFSMIASSEVCAQKTTMVLRLQGEAISIQGELVWRIDPAGTTASDIQMVPSTIDSTLLASCPNISEAVKNGLLHQLTLMKKAESKSGAFTSP